NSESVKFVRNSRAKILSESVMEKISDEAKITFENFFVWEEFHFLWEDNPDDDAAWDLLDNQHKKCMQYGAAHLDEEKNIYHSLSMLELANSFMPKMKFSDVVKIGLEEKKFYDSIIENDSANCTTYFNAALWYHFAPAIGGGSESKAEKYFSEALKKASTDYEKFFANFYFSQFEFDRGEKASFEKYFSAAEKIIPESGFLEFTRRLNKAGFSYLEYTKNREKVEKSLNRR
ncbi:MAG: hypothetical protein K2I95_04395, partial [Treponemataceae bacterium]|nr:hypothetical protein [Treponemataceae bacterium]